MKTSTSIKGNTINTTETVSDAVAVGRDLKASIQVDVYGGSGDSDEFIVTQYNSEDGEHYDSVGEWLTSFNLNSDTPVVKIVNCFETEHMRIGCKMKSTSSETPTAAVWYKLYDSDGAEVES